MTLYPKLILDALATVRYHLLVFNPLRLLRL